MLDNRGRFSEAAVFIDWIRSNIATAVIGNENEFAGVVDGYMTWVSAFRSLLVQGLEFARCAINCEGANAAGFGFSFEALRFVHGIKNLLVRVHRQEARV